MVEIGGWAGLADRGGGLVRVLRRGGQLHLRQDGVAGRTVGRLSREEGVADGNRCRSGRTRASSTSSSGCSRSRSSSRPRSSASGPSWAIRRSTRRRPPTRSPGGRRARRSCSTGTSSRPKGSNDSEPALLQVVRGRADQRLRPVPRPPRRGRATATGSPTTGAARRARSATSPTPSCSRDAQRFANALKDLGVEKGDVVGIYLPMIPEVAVAMLACARIGAIHNVVFGGFSAESVRERMEFSEAKALVTVDGARRKGKTAPIKEQVDEEMGDRRALETIVVVRAHRDRLPDDRGPRRLLRRGLRGGRPGVPGGADGGRAPALHPLHLRLDREAEGDPPHHRRLPDRGRPPPTATSST